MSLDSSTAITIGGVSCWDEGTEETFARTGSQATRTIVTAWNDRVALASAVMGGSAIIGGAIVASSPLTYPDAPWMYCQAVTLDGGEGTPFVGSNGMIAFKYARLKLVYKPLDFEAGKETGEERISTSSEVASFSMTEPTFMWASDAKKVDPTANPTRRFSTVTFSKVIKSLASIPINAMIALTDTVNNATFLGAPPGQLLFLNGNSTQRFVPGGGAHNYDVEYCFKFRSIDWRKQFRPGAGWQTAMFSDGSPLYGTGDFTTLGFGP